MSEPIWKNHVNLRRDFVAALSNDFGITRRNASLISVLRFKHCCDHHTTALSADLHSQG